MDEVIRLFGKRGDENESDNGVSRAPSGLVSASESDDCYVVVTLSSSGDDEEGGLGSGGFRTRKNRGVIRYLNLLRPPEGSHCLYPQCPPSMQSLSSLRDLYLRSAASLRNANGGGARRAVKSGQNNWDDISVVVSTQDILLSDCVINITTGKGVGGGRGGVGSGVGFSCYLPAAMCPVPRRKKRVGGSLKSRN